MSTFSKYYVSNKLHALICECRLRWNENFTSEYLIRVRALMRALELGEILPGRLREIVSRETIHPFSSHCPDAMLMQMKLVAAEVGVHIRHMALGPFYFLEDLQERIQLEQDYTSSGGMGSPSHMTSTFLELWRKADQEGRLQDQFESRLFHALNSVEIRLAKLTERLQALDKLEVELQYYRNLRQAPPSKESLLQMNRIRLREVAEAWGFHLPTKCSEARCRSLLLTFFKY